MADVDREQGPGAEQDAAHQEARPDLHHREDDARRHATRNDGEVGQESATEIADALHHADGHRHETTAGLRQEW